MHEDIPDLYETEPTPVDQKIIHERYYLPEHDGVYWLIAEYNPDEELAFGYACLNDPIMAEWGYFAIPELEEVGAVPDEAWQPCQFTEALRRLEGDVQ